MDTDAVKFFKSDISGSSPHSGTHLRNTIVFAGLMPLFLLGFVRRRRIAMLAVIVAASLGVLSTTSCGTKYPDHVAPGTYTVTILATGVNQPIPVTVPAASPVPTHKLAITLTVTP